MERKIVLRTFRLLSTIKLHLIFVGRQPPGLNSTAIAAADISGTAALSQPPAKIERLRGLMAKNSYILLK
jgi:hypothetical protein